MIKYFKAEFFGLAKRRSHQTTAGGKVQFFKPDFEFVELTDWQEVSLVRLNEVEVGPHWKFKTNGWFGSGLDVFFRTGQKRFENQKLIKEVLLFPNFKDRDPSVRHVHAFTDSVHINPEWTRIQGEAYFQVEVPDAVKDLSVVLNDQTGKMEWGGTTHIVGQTDTLDESNTDFASFNTRVNQRVLPTWNRWLNWILLLAGVGFLPLLPWLGLSLLYYPLRSWSRSSSPLATSGISMFWILLGGLLVGIAMGLKSPFAWPLALAYLLLIVVRKGARRGWVIGASVLFLLFALLAFLPLLSNRLVKESEGDGSSVVKTKREKKEGSNEVIARHTIQWLYPERTPNNAEYATSDNEYTRSLSHHGQISGLQASEELEFWNSAYAHLLQHDQGKVDSVARIVRDVAQRRKYTPLQTAEYLVTMIQEVPYVLVHDLSCKEAVMQYKGFVAQYHIQGKPCLPNIVAGVQSPYEFMHNLKGDCDTRSLFGHAVLNRLGISSSVWVSSAYGHSILGVGVPGSSGNRKVINGVPHYGVELTAKGFRIGMVAPDQRQMSNWNVAIYSNF
jgi:hypothetical protein